MKQLIDTREKLERLCRELAQEKLLALDTEFVSERNYFPCLGIIQVASLREAYVIDAITIDDLGAFLRLLEEPSIVKIFHAGRQDIEIFLQKGAHRVHPVFDTQVAAAFLGYGEQISYAKLVELKAKVHLSKTETFTDWCVRPLTQRQIEYARADVRYLPAIYEKLHRDLNRVGRLRWVDEEFAALLKVAARKSAPETGGEVRVKGASGLAPKQLAVLDELTAWREERARSVNVPRRRLLPDHLLLEIARRAPVTADDLNEIRTMSSRFSPGDVTGILDSVSRGLSGKGVAGAHAGKEKLDIVPGAAWLAGLLLAYVRGKAEWDRISPGVVATTEDVQSLLRAHYFRTSLALRLLEGWRREYVGEELLGILDGKLHVGLAEPGGRLAVFPADPPR